MKQKAFVIFRHVKKSDMAIPKIWDNKFCYLYNVSEFILHTYSHIITIAQKKGK